MFNANADIRRSYRAAVRARTRKGSAAHPGTCTTAALVGRTMQKKFDAADVELEAELLAMVKEGLVVCTSGQWFNR